MPGQPLSKLSGGVDLEFGAGSLSKRPALAKHVMFVIEQWSMTEMQMLLILRHCLGGDPTVVAEMLDKIDNQTTRRIVIITAAKAVVERDDQAMIEAAFFTMNASRAARHKFAHHIWGTAVDMPDALLLLDPNDMAVGLAHELKRQAVAKKTKGIGPTPKKVDEIVDRSKIVVWRKNDLVSECNASMRAASLTQSIIKFVYLTRNQKEEVDSIRQVLLSDPLVQQKIRNLNKQKHPPAPS